jgi:hypothetical protein
MMKLDPEVERYLAAFTRRRGLHYDPSHPLRAELLHAYLNHVPRTADTWSAFVAGATIVAVLLNSSPARLNHKLHCMLLVTAGVIIGLLLPQGLK